MASLTSVPTPVPVSAPVSPPTVEDTASLPASRPAKNRLWAWATSLNREWVLVIILIGIGLLAHSWNMFHYPSFMIKDDEGIYSEQAWSVLREGQITHYTYTYDHAPVGWIQLAMWMGLVGGPNSFGFAIDTGRVLMLLLHLAMIPMLYMLVRKLKGSVAAATLATLIFSLSPLAIFYQRMVLLDNIMLFWALLSMNLLLDGKGRLSRVVLSGLCFGMALLSKETAIFLLPVMLFMVWQQRWEHQGRFAFGGWLVPMLAVVTWYPLFAILKGELLPAPTLATNLANNGHAVTGVSLVDAWLWQATRKDEGQLWHGILATDWLVRDPLILVGGAVASLLNLLRSFLDPKVFTGARLGRKSLIGTGIAIIKGLFNRYLFVVGLLGLLPLFYLFRGGVVFDYYIIFAIPFMALNLAFLADWVLAHIARLVAGLAVVAIVAGLLSFYWLSGTLQPLYAEQPDQSGRAAVSWIKQNLPADSRMIMRDDMWTDLHEASSGGPAFPNAHTHWKVAYDPAIYNTLFKNDWHNVDYLIMSSGLNYAFELTNDQLALQALSHATMIKRWVSPAGDERLHPVQTIEIWKVNKDDSVPASDISTPAKGTFTPVNDTTAGLLKANQFFLTTSFEQNGAFIGFDGTATAESQANAMLRAVWMQDQDGFRRAWNWTKTHLMNPQGLLYWQWWQNSIIDNHTASDADSDTALALLMASRQWHDPALLQAGQALVSAIWQHEVTQVNGKPYLTGGDWTVNAATIALSPGYFAPYAYRIFQEVDPAHDWHGVIDSGYDLLAKVNSATLGYPQATGITPDWIGLKRDSGELVPLTLTDGQPSPLDFGPEAARSYWRVALDLAWSGEPRAKTYLNQATFIQQEFQLKGFFSGEYTHDGTVVKVDPDMMTTAGAIAAMLTIDQSRAKAVYQDQVVKETERTTRNMYWDGGFLTDLTPNEWSWFATALYNQALPDVWHISGGTSQ